MKLRTTYLLVTALTLLAIPSASGQEGREKEPLIFFKKSGNDRVMDVAISPNGEKVVCTGVVDNTAHTSWIEVYDIKTGKKIGDCGPPGQVLAGKERYIHFVRFSSDNRYIINGDRNYVCVWNSATCELVQRLERPLPSRVHFANLSKNGRQLLVVANNVYSGNFSVDAVYFFDVKTKRGLNKTLLPRGGVNLFEIGRNRYFATFYKDPDLYCIRTSGKTAYKLKNALRFALSADKLQVLLMDNDGKVSVYQASNGRKLKDLGATDKASQQFTCTRLGFLTGTSFGYASNPYDGNHGSDLWNLKEGRKLVEFPFSIWAVTPDGRKAFAS